MENDLGATQTCTACGAPLVKTRGIFSKPVLFGVVLALLLFLMLCVFGPRLGR